VCSLPNQDAVEYEVTETQLEPSRFLILLLFTLLLLPCLSASVPPWRLGSLVRVLLGTNQLSGSYLPICLAVCVTGGGAATDVIGYVCISTCREGQRSQGMCSSQD